jgi:predicted DNA-binding transcriptional regulator AlpA
VATAASRRRQRRRLLSSASHRLRQDESKKLASFAKPAPSKVLLGLADLHALGISYSRQHLYRLMNEGRFPRQVALGNPKQLYAKKCWRADDIERWLAALLYTSNTDNDEAP